MPSPPSNRASARLPSSVVPRLLHAVFALFALFAWGGLEGQCVPLLPAKGERAPPRRSSAIPSAPRSRPGCCGDPGRAPSRNALCADYRDHRNALFLLTLTAYAMLKEVIRMTYEGEWEYGS